VGEAEKVGSSGVAGGEERSKKKPGRKKGFSLREDGGRRKKMDLAQLSSGTRGGGCYGSWGKLTQGGNSAVFDEEVEGEVSLIPT